MCGIYGFVGHNAVNETLNGIKKLEYRGYDSSGIGFFSYTFGLKDNKEYKNNVFKFNSGLNIIKEKGEISRLEHIVNQLKPTSDIAIGHTRWATHGEPSIINSHPHYSDNGNWIVVHNGIVENYLDLKKELNNVKFNSDTDTEVIAQMLSYNYDGDVLSTIKKVCDKLVGSYALAIINKKHPDSIFVAKLNSPCVVGVGKNCGVVCSDINSIEKVDSMYMLPNYSYAVVGKGNVEIYDKYLNIINLPKVVKSDTAEDKGLDGYKHYMIKEINEIPQGIINTVASYNTFEKIKKVLPKKVINRTRNILIIGCGTAYHAGLIAKRIIEDRCNIKVDVEIASEFRYNNFQPSSNTLAVFISQSGETADTIKAVKMCKAYGLTTLAVTNVANSSIVYEVDYCMYTRAGKEVAVASTKAYNCQCAIFYLISSYIKAIKTDNPDIVLEESKRLIDVANNIKINRIKDICNQVAEEIKDSKSIYMIGRNIDYYTALESSLKLKEISYIHCEAYPAGELKHGTISLIDNNQFVFAFVTQDMIKEKTLSNINEVTTRQGKVIVVSQFKLNYENKIYKEIMLPKIDEKYMPIVSVVYMQLIAYYTSLKLGNNPDKPRSLAKSVTVE